MQGPTSKEDSRIQAPLDKPRAPFKEMFDSLQKQDIVTVLDAVQFKDKSTGVYRKLARYGENFLQVF